MDQCATSTHFLCKGSVSGSVGVIQELVQVRPWSHFWPGFTERILQVGLCLQSYVELALLLLKSLGTRWIHNMFIYCVHVNVGELTVTHFTYCQGRYCSMGKWLWWKEDQKKVRGVARSTCCKLRLWCYIWQGGHWSDRLTDVEKGNVAFVLQWVSAAGWYACNSCSLFTNFEL